MHYALHREVKRGSISGVRELLRAGADVNKTDLSGHTPLVYALQNAAASVEIVELLLDAGGVVPQTSQYDGEINLASVCLRGGDPDKLNAVLRHGADLHYTRSAGYDALMDAAFSPAVRTNQRLLDVLRILLGHGVELNSISTYSESALRTFARFGRFDAIRLLLEAGADRTLLQWTPLHQAVALGTLAEVKVLAENGADLEAVDSWACTPWLLAVRAGDLDKARYLIERGADFTATPRARSTLDLAIESFRTPMLEWLIKLGFGVEASADCCSTPLMLAVEAGNAEAVDVLIAAGADLDRRTACGTALDKAQTREITLKMLGAGADPANLSFEGRRAIVGLEPQPDESLFDATHEEFELAPTAFWGLTNPERVEQPFWQAMIRSGLNAYQGRQLAGGDDDQFPVWCAQRFGQSLTILGDGRTIQIGGEHEDSYDSDFCIYNDVFVHHPDGRIDIYCYPEAVFPPTDFHTATLIGDSIYIIGSVGYHGSRRYGETPVYALHTGSLEMRRIDCTGDVPGWISRHRAVVAGPQAIRISGGKIFSRSGGKETYEDNHRIWILDLNRNRWHIENPA